MKVNCHKIDYEALDLALKRYENAKQFVEIGISEETYRRMSNDGVIKSYCYYNGFCLYFNYDADFGAFEIREKNGLVAVLSELVDKINCAKFDADDETDPYIRGWNNCIEEMKKILNEFVHRNLKRALNIF